MEIHVSFKASSWTLLLKCSCTAGHSVSFQLWLFLTFFMPSLKCTVWLHTYKTRNVTFVPINWNCSYTFNKACEFIKTLYIFVFLCWCDLIYLWYEVYGLGDLWLNKSYTEKLPIASVIEDSSCPWYVLPSATLGNKCFWDVGPTVSVLMQFYHLVNHVRRKSPNPFRSVSHYWIRLPQNEWLEAILTQCLCTILHLKSQKSQVHGCKCYIILQLSGQQ